MPSPTLWLTRPTADNEWLAQQLRAHEINTIISPVLNIEYSEYSLLNDISHVTYKAVLLTSQHAVPAFSRLPLSIRQLPVFCIGDATAQAAKNAGAAYIISGDGDFYTLFSHLVSHLKPNQHLLYLTGEDKKHDAAKLLNAKQIITDQTIVYKARPENSLNKDLIEALISERVKGAVFFSPRTARLAYSLLDAFNLSHHLARLDAYCLSLAVAEAAGAHPWKRIHACPRPTREAMVDLLVSHTQLPL